MNGFRYRHYGLSHKVHRFFFFVSIHDKYFGIGIFIAIKSIMKKIITLFCLSILVLTGFSLGTVRDGFVEILTRKVESTEVQQFFSSYNIKNTAGGKYSSAENGIDITTKGDSVVQVDVYRKSAVYGSYTRPLSKGLAFGMTPAQVIAKLGKPTTSYTNSGYAEYDFPGYVITCWYEDGGLSQLSYSPKTQ